MTGVASPALQDPRSAPAARPAWNLPHYVIKERRFTIGRQYEVLDPSGRLLAYCKQKIFRLKEDIRFFADREQTREEFRLRARKILDFKANVDVVAASGDVLGSVRRKGWKSLVKDEWLLFDAHGTHIGTLHEQGGLRAFFRRWGDAVSTFIPARFTLFLGPSGAQREAAQLRERFQMWGDTYDLRIASGAPIDHRLVVAVAVLTDAMGVGGAAS